jgi:hypothetical protein
VALLLVFGSISIVWGQNLHVLVNIWDGTQASVVKNIYNNGNLPFLNSVGPLYNLTSNEECFNGTCMKTVTKPQHATMLTGCLADVTGVYSNGIYQLIPDGITVYELIESNNKEYRTAHISGKSKHVGEPTFGNIVSDIDFFQALDINPPMNTDIAIDLITQWRDYSFFIVCHFRNPDNIGHKFGVTSLEYRKSIRNNDKQLGRLLEALNANSAGADTIVYVLSDHGFGCPKPTAHSCSPNTFIVSNDANLTGDIFMKDVAGYLLSNFGLSPVCQ